MNKYNFLYEEQEDPAIDPNAAMQQPQEDPNMMQQGGDASTDFKPLINGPEDVPLSKDRADKLLIAAKIREIEAKTKETLAKINNPDTGASAVDPVTGAPIDPNMAGGQIDPTTGIPMQIQAGQIDPMTGAPIDPNSQQNNDPLMGLGDASAPQDPMAMGGMGAIDPMTGMPIPDQGPSKTFTAIGRAYKLKKIYDILDKLSYLLHTTPDTKLQEISKQVDESFELFRLVINNLKLYKDQVDDLIVMYYSMLKDICDNIENVYKERKLESSITESKKIRKCLTLLGEGIEE